MSLLRPGFSTVISITVIAVGLSAANAVVMPGSAEARQSTTNFTCNGLHDFVDRRGAVVLNTKSGRIYRRFVRDRTFCPLNEKTRRYTVPTRDGGCRLNICYEPIGRRGAGR